MKIKGLDQVVAWIIAAVLGGGAAAGFYYYTKYNVDKRLKDDEAEALAAMAAMTKKRQAEERAEKRAVQLDLEQESDKKTAPRPAAGSDTWNYAGSKGPAFWADLNASFALCSRGKTQSPINIIDAESDQHLKPLKFDYHRRRVVLTMANQIVQVEVDPGPYLDIDAIPYGLKKIYFHTPGEHQVGGLPYEMEIQFEHQSASGQKAMVALPVFSGKSTPAAWAQLLQELPEFSSDEKVMELFALDELLPKTRKYFSYTGSETHPPCREGVMWYVFTEPLILKQFDVDRIARLQRFNARPLQARGGRKIGRSLR